MALIEEAAKLYGNQCVVLSADIKRIDGNFHVFAKGGREACGSIWKVADKLMKSLLIR